MAKTKSEKAAELPKMPKPLPDEGTVDAHRKDVKEVAAKMAKNPLFREEGDARAEDMKLIIHEVMEKNNALRARAEKVKSNYDYDKRKAFIEEMMGNISKELEKPDKKIDEGKIEDALFSLRILGDFNAVGPLEDAAVKLWEKPGLGPNGEMAHGTILTTVRSIREDNERNRLELHSKG